MLAGNRQLGKTRSSWVATSTEGVARGSYRHEMWDCGRLRRPGRTRDSCGAPPGSACVDARGSSLTFLRSPSDAVQPSDVGVESFCSFPGRKPMAMAMIDRRPAKPEPSRNSAKSNTPAYHRPVAAVCFRPSSVALSIPSSGAGPNACCVLEDPSAGVVMARSEFEEAEESHCSRGSQLRSWRSAAQLGLALVSSALTLACGRPTTPTGSAPMPTVSSKRTMAADSDVTAKQRSAPDPRDPGPRSPDSGAEAKAEARVPPLPPSKVAMPARLVAIGDLHGDLEAARQVLRLAGAIDERDAWVGGELVIVQTGDLLDRGNDERALLELFARLQAQALAARGAVYVMNGNHEYMNVSGDLRYVTATGFEQYADHAPAGQDPRWGRKLAFAPGSALARQLAGRPAILMVGTVVFAHGGVVPAVAELGIAAVNRLSHAWLTGQLQTPPELLSHPEGPVWTRSFASEPEHSACRLLDATLAELGATHMVVGHTVQKAGVRSRCNGRVWMIDVGMADFYGGPIQALEFSSDGPRVLRGGPH